jgi:hypothetical protein
MDENGGIEGPGMTDGEGGDKREEAGRKRPRVTRALLWLGGAALGLLLLVGVVNILAPRAMGRVFVGPPTPTPSPIAARPKAAIIDQTGYSFPSPDFIAEARDTLEEAGYEVEYFAPEEITVGFYRTLPDKGFDFILFQTHSTSEVMVTDENKEESDYAPGPFLFTTELYAQQRYLTLQVSDQVRASELFFEGSPLLFAVGPEFVRRSMRGLFPDTVIVIGGCQSLAAPDLARAFLEKGASTVIGWDEMVNLSHNNEAVLRLLEALLVEGASAEEAVERAMADVGLDPRYESSLDVMQ